MQTVKLVGAENFCTTRRRAGFNSSAKICCSCGSSGASAWVAGHSHNGRLDTDTSDPNAHNFDATVYRVDHTVAPAVSGNDSSTCCQSENSPPFPELWWTSKERILIETAISSQINSSLIRTVVKFSNANVSCTTNHEACDFLFLV